MEQCQRCLATCVELVGLAHQKPRLDLRYFLGQLLMDTSSTAQGGGGSFKNRTPIGEVGCCESRMAERIH